MAEDTTSDQPEPDAAQQTGTPPSAFPTLLGRYRSSISNLREFFRHLTPIAAAHDSDSAGKLGRQFEALSQRLDQRHGANELADAKLVVRIFDPASFPDVVIPTRGSPFKTEFGSDLFQHFLERVHTVPVKTHHEQLASAVITSSVTAFEVLLGNVMLAYYRLIPKAVSDETKYFSLDELARFDSIDDAILSIMSKRVDSFVKGSVEDWADDLMRKLKIDIRACVPEWSQFDEVFQRRHVIVHSDGKVDKNYLDRVDFSRVRWPEATPELNSDLTMSDEYVDHALDLFEIAGVELAHLFWRKLVPTEADLRWRSVPAPYGLPQCIYAPVLEGRWFAAEQISAFAVSDSSTDEASRLIARFNRWLAMKRLGRWDEARAELEALDISAVQPRFKVVRASLLERADEFFDWLPSAELSIRDLRDWPILDEMRHDPRYVAALAEALGREHPESPVDIAGEAEVGRLEDAIKAAEPEPMNTADESASDPAEAD